MNKSDEFWFFLSMAITRPKSSNISFYYDKKRNELFGIETIGKQILPCFKNSVTEKSEEKRVMFDLIILDIKKGSSNFILLPIMSLGEKKQFFIQFVSALTHCEFKNKLLNDIAIFNENDNFNLKIDLKQIDKTIAFEYDMERGKYIANKIEEHYFSLGISKISTVLW